MPTTLGLTPHLPQFRAAWGRLVGLLTRSARLSDPSLAEDAVQHAMLQATRLWPVNGAPDEPLAWLTRVARNHLTDSLRARARDVQWDPLAVETRSVEASTPASGQELNDDELALLFACSDPALPVASQVALALKVVCGFSLGEIAAGLLSDEAALAQRLARARRVLAARRMPIAIPAGAALPPRREAVLVAIHLLFNEGYTASSGEAPQRPDLCREAIRLVRALAAHPVVAHGDVDALAALLLIQGARLGARVDAQGDWLLLDEQDRDRWDRALITAGMVHLDRSRRAGHLSAWHLRAGIVAEHVASSSFAATRWAAIVELYELLLRLDDAPTTRLAHAVALAHAEGAEVALPILKALLPRLPRAAGAYGEASLAHVLGQLGRMEEARAALDRAIAAAVHPAARRLLERKRAAC